MFNLHFILPIVSTHSPTPQTEMALVLMEGAALTLLPKFISALYIFHVLGLTLTGLLMEILESVKVIFFMYIQAVNAFTGLWTFFFISITGSQLFPRV